MNQLSLYYPILNVIRQELKCYEYKPDTNKKVVIISEDGKKTKQTSISSFMIRAQK